MENKCLKSRCLDERAKCLQEVKQLHLEIEALKKERNLYKYISYTGSLILMFLIVLDIIR